MLGGLDPIIIFQFAKLAPIAGSTIERIPLVSEIPTLIEMPPIPIYFSQSLTGIYIDAESKNVDFSTDSESLTSGADPDVNQKTIGNVVSINLLAKKDSIGLALLTSMIDLVYPKAASKEYAITYLHGPITIFRGVLHSYSVDQNAENDLLNIKIELSKGGKNPVKDTPVPSVPGLGPSPLPGG